MANWCELEITIWTTNPENLTRQLQQKLTEAKERNHGLFIGSDRYLFDGQVDFNGRSVMVFGDVKWCFSKDEMEKFVEFIRQLDSTLQTIDVEYLEVGCELFGRYHYENSWLVHTFIDDDFPEWQEDDDEFYEKLATALEKSGVEENWEVGYGLDDV